MLFTDPIFLFKFLPVVIAGFAVLLFAGTRISRHVFLIGASLVFYSWFKVEYLALLLGSIVVNYAIAREILKAPGGRRQKHLLILGIVLNLGLLGVYKYLGFFAFNLNALFAVGLPDPGLLLPLAISFFTFQQISYLCDAYTGKIEAKAHTPVEYGLFVTFFPQLIAGPIVHHSEMMPQFRTSPVFQARCKMFCEGLMLFALGLFKKLVIADSLAPYADLVFNTVDAGQAVDMATAWTGTLAYTFQIYFDFSGYSDMAIGLGLLFGIRLPWNFNSPYKAENISEFWRRWHMTLSRWLRDYLYIPLGGNRKGKVRQYANNFTTMLLGGLWHGAHWNFVIWGALHGLYLIINQLFRAGAARVGILEMTERFAAFRFAGWGFTFLGTVVAWVFFRATTTDGAFSMLGAMLWGLPGLSIVTDMQTSTLLLAAAAIAFLAPNTKQLSEAFNRTSWSALWTRALVYGGLTGTASAGAYLASLSVAQSPFLYFNF
ncbi:MBOAT family protein [Hyphomonas sp. FCG-A18]|uniref:MBOAT family O-acyltransferase n=1 Tax=Hyphomonas sp. FCG-A18 TaxID=3080019 RepID=UPI002B27FB24|nr:MBOAT family protein [Hyphomonas sp. FCG-A18]